MIEHDRRPRRGVLLAPVLFFFVFAVAHSSIATADPDKDAVIASQGGAQVTLADVDAFSTSIPEKQRPAFFNSPERIQTLIMNLLLQKQLAAQARKEGLQSSPDVLKVPAAEREKALSQAEIARFKTELKIPDFGELASEEYIAHREKYGIPAQLSVKNILISTKTRSEADAKALADKVEAEARKDPSGFDALVDKYSDDPGKATTQGLLSQIDEARVGAPLTRAAEALEKPGDISPVVKTGYGFDVLQLVAKAPAQSRTFAEARSDIIASLRNQYVDKSLKDYVDNLRNKPIDANPDLVASLRTRYGRPPQLPDNAMGK